MGAKMGELRPPAISHPRLSDRCPSADLAIPGLHPVVHKTKRGARKARIQRSGMGKRKEVGTWSITWRLVGDRFYMMATYPKSERADLSTEQRRRILAALESIKKSKS